MVLKPIGRYDGLVAVLPLPSAITLLCFGEAVIVVIYRSQLTDFIAESKTAPGQKLRESPRPSPDHADKLDRGEIARGCRDLLTPNHLRPA